MPSSPLSDWVLVTPEALSLETLVSWATQPDCGAVVTFSGVVRNFSSAHEHVFALEYDTDLELAERRLREVVAEARRRWPSLVSVAVHHRVGRVELRDATVLVVVAAPHRAEAFAAAAFCIDTLKATVPLWKREHFAGGSAWSNEGTAIVEVPRQ